MFSVLRVHLGTIFVKIKNSDVYLMCGVINKVAKWKQNGIKFFQISLSNDRTFICKMQSTFMFLFLPASANC